jgi:hypothetical protein
MIFERLQFEGLHRLLAKIGNPWSPRNSERRSEVIADIGRRLPRIVWDAVLAAKALNCS